MRWDLVPPHRIAVRSVVRHHSGMASVRRLLLLTACAAAASVATSAPGAHAAPRACLPGAVADIDYELGLFQQQTSYDLERLEGDDAGTFTAVTITRAGAMTTASVAALVRGLQPAPCP